MLALRRSRTRVVVAGCLVACLGAACQAPVPDRELRILTGGNPDNGPDRLRRHGCVACHTVSAMHDARGHVGPALDGVSRRAFIAGRLENTPRNLVRWVRDARGTVPGTAMPSLGVSDQDARDIAAYLYTLHD